MNIVFFGTSEFAVPALTALIDSPHKVLAVVTQPDRKAGRNLKLTPPPVKALAESRAIPVYQPQDASCAEAAAYLTKLGADLFVVISFGQILKRQILSIPKFYSINVHGSLLPKYRGAAPTNWAVINGDETSGVTVIRMNERMDEGEMILKKEAVLEAGDTNSTLTGKLSGLGAQALIEAIDLIAQKKERLEPQDPAKATYAPKLKKTDGIIDWAQPAAVIDRRVRGLLPWPGAYTHYNGKALKILHTELAGVRPDGGAKPGTVIAIVRNSGIVVSTGSGAIVIKNVQLEGGKPLDTDAFVRGHPLKAGDAFA